MPSLPETRASLILRLPDAADARAWDDFASVYAPVVYRLARRMGLQPADGDDLVQEVLAAVARSVEGWLAKPERGPFRAWLFTIAKNQAVNALRRKKHTPRGTGDSGMGQLLARQAANGVKANGEEASEFDLEYRRELFRSAAERAREEVTERTWQAFWLSTVEARPIGEVAKELGMSVGSVYIARSRVMGRLREVVGQQKGSGWYSGENTRGVQGSG